MTNSLSILQQSVTKNKPNPEQINQALLEIEKNSKKSKESYLFQQLLGTWQLYFITGTKKAKKRAGIVLGKGFYLPSFFKATLNYSLNENQGNTEEFIAGIMKNSVQFGLMSLTFSGCTKFLPQKNILAFDFTRINIDVLGKTIYQGEIRGGKNQEAKFYQEKIKKQAFFHYFYLGENLISARGKGGGLAIWKKV